MFAADDPAAVRHFSETGWVATADPAGPSPAALQAWADEIAALNLKLQVNRAHQRKANAALDSWALSDDLPEPTPDEPQA